VYEISELKREGLSVQAISELLGYDRKTIRKYLIQPDAVLEYGPRGQMRPSKLDPHLDYLQDRLKAGVWNAEVLLRELKQRGYHGGRTILKDWLHPRRAESRATAVRRFETAPGQQAQVDWGHLAYLSSRQCRRRVWGFTMTMGYSRRMWAEAAMDQKMGTLLRMHEAAFRDWDGVPQEILYDRMRTVWLDHDDRGEIVWHPVFRDFARYWGFQPRLCRAYRAQTKGKVESGVKYIRRNFVCGLRGREPSCLADFNAELRQWLAVSNQRVHGTTHEPIPARWNADHAGCVPIHGRPAYTYSDDELRTVSPDAYVSWQTCRYSVDWKYAGKQVWARETGSDVEIYHGETCIARHAVSSHKHQVITQPQHHRGIPLGSCPRHGRKILIEMCQAAPSVEARSLAAYEHLAQEGGR
jgi:transposase